jgi:hypothetical protein
MIACNNLTYIRKQTLYYNNFIQQIKVMVSIAYLNILF